MLVKQILSSKSISAVETIPPDRPISDAVHRLGERKIGALIVSDDGNTVAGVISERDIVREIGLQGASILDRPVSSVMTAKVQSCAPGDTAESVLSTMTTGRFRHMPVMENGAMVGVISLGDVVKARLGEVEMERGALEDMIRGV